MERAKIRWLALLIVLAMFGIIGWSFELFGPVVVGHVL